MFYIPPFSLEWKRSTHEYVPYRISVFLRSKVGDVNVVVDARNLLVLAAVCYSTRRGRHGKEGWYGMVWYTLCLEL